MLLRLGIAAIVMTAALVLAYPVAYLSTHGLNPDGWPHVVDADGLPFRGAVRPDDWVAALHRGDVRLIVPTDLDMFEGRSPLLSGGGQAAFVIALGVAAAFIIFLFASWRQVEERHHSGRFGRARWATRRERSRLNHGLEVGVDPETNRPIRVPVEGNLVTIAPPRTGKTSAFILTNLADPDATAWHGPAVVIDPKGDAYRAARQRRARLGRVVRCLDPYALIGGPDRWNPLRRLEPDDVGRLQGIARTLLPGMVNPTPADEYFHTRAAAVIVAALQCAIRSDQPYAATAAALTRDPEALAAKLQGRTDAVAGTVRQVLASDPRTRDPIIATVQQAFNWALDPRAEASTQNATFDLEDVCRGTADLFIVVPADDRAGILAPYVRWLLGDLFDAVRRNRPAERLVFFIDEAFVLGRYDAVLKGVGELPGYGVTLWTIWQSRAQMVEAYGQAGAQILTETAEVTTLFNLAQSSPDELDHWSRALGTWTAVEAVDPKSKKPSEPVVQALVAPSDLPALLQHQAVVFVNNRTHTTYPILVRKRFAHRNRHLRRLLDLNAIRPVGSMRHGRRAPTP